MNSKFKSETNWIVLKLIKDKSLLNGDQQLTGYSRDCAELINSFQKIMESLDAEEKIENLEKYFLERPKEDFEVMIEDNLLKSYRKLRKIREALKKEMKKEMKKEEKREDKLRMEFQERLRRYERRYLQERDFFSFSIIQSGSSGYQVTEFFY